MKGLLVAFSLLVTVGAQCVFAAQGTVDVSIRFYNQNVVYPDSKVPIKIDITNNSPQTYKFELADRHPFDLDFDVRTLTNLAVAPADKFIMDRNANQPVLYREVSLDPGDTYSFVEDLTDYVKITDPGVYVVQATFYPTLYSPGASDTIVSNKLTLNVRPGTTPAMQATIDMQTGEILQRQDLPPDDVVSYVLKARQQSQWNKFFLYIDVQDLMLQQPDMKRRFDRASDQQQHDMVSAFKQQLQQQKTDNDIVVVPSDFTILKTTYTPTEATVEVQEKFTYPTYTDIKNYTYYLQRPESVWMIYNYSVRNMGTQ